MFFYTINENYDVSLNKKINENKMENFIIKKRTNKNIKDYLKFALNEMKSKSKLDYKILNYKYCLDSIQRECLYIEFEPCGALLINLEDNDVLINIPFKQNLKNEMISLPSKIESITSFENKIPIFNLKTLKLEGKTESKYKDFLENKSFNTEIPTTPTVFDIKNNTQTYSSGNAENKIPHYDGLINADVEVPYSWWFKINRNNFGYTDVATIQNDNSSQGLCHYVAAGMLIQYMEFFRTSGYFTEDEIKEYIEIPEKNLVDPDFPNLPVIPTVNGKLVEYLWRKCSFNNAIRTTGDAMARIIRKFITKRKKTAPSYWVESKTWGFIKPWKMIDEKTPFMLYSLELPDPSSNSKTGHSVVVYGYYKENGNGGKYLCHYGWGGYSQVIASTNAWKWMWTVRIDLWKESEAVSPRKYFAFKNEMISGKEYGKTPRK